MKNICISDKLKNFLEHETGDFTFIERIIFPVVVLIIIFSSIIARDNAIAVLSAICGISYTVFNGKGKIYCYFFGIISSLCYSYLAFKNGLWANFFLNFLYYFPLQIFGILNWKKYLKKNTANIEKTRLNNNEKVIYYGFSVLITLVIFAIVKFYSLTILNFLDYSVLIYSVIAMIMAVKRCIEQWYYWIIVNILSVIIWIAAWHIGSGHLALILMWGIYLILGIYFLIQWRKQV